jgi:alpha-glucuronidase
LSISRREFLQVELAASIAAASSHLHAHAVPAPPAASPVPVTLPDEDGYELWLRYRLVTDAELLAHYRAATARMVLPSSSPLAQSIADELGRACKGMLDQTPATAQSVTANGTILIATPDASPTIRQVVDPTRLSALGDEGFVLKTTSIDGFTTIVVAANHDRGLLYGAFALILQMQLRQPLDALDIVDAPRAHIRMVNHWDDIDRTIERGYAGLSIFRFDDLTAPNPRYEDYARLLASVGINGTVINDVNSSPEFLDSAMIPGYVNLAGILRRWGIKLYLAANFACPIDLTAHDPQPITTADPLDNTVQAWWSMKADEIYGAIPDFGGFLVKASSEGEPGPLTYNRTHAQGANMLAAAVKPHGGIVVWRSFVHGGFQGWSEYEYRTFHPLDGQFDSNVVLQTKNGPIDFLVREPINPLFGAMPRTNQMIEFQLTQEYTGHATHLCYLPTYWHWVLTFDTHSTDSGPTVAQVIDGTADNQPLTGFAGVINFGDDRNWTGSFLAAANTHGFARLAWNHTRDVQDIAAEWVKLTFGLDQAVVSTIVPMLLSSWRTYEQYTSPFGVGYMMRPIGAHFEPDPRATLNLSHSTDSRGSGFDRTLATGTGFTRFYSDYWFQRYESLDTCPEELLMFMHVVPWDHPLANGNTAIQQIYDDHFAGVDQVLAMAQIWKSLEGRIDGQRFSAISRQFDRQILQSQIWRDVMVSYYFDNSHTTGSNQQWVQLEMSETRTYENPLLLLGGVANDVSLSLTNATDNPQTLTVSIEPSLVGWTAGSAHVTVYPHETESVVFSITPAIEPYLGPAGFIGKPADLAILGFGTQIMIVTPSADKCTFAFDVGSAPNNVVTGYRALVAADTWNDRATYGWVGTPPTDTRLATNWDRLQDDCASDGVPRTLRLRIPPGQQRAWVLIGGQGSGTQPVHLMLGQETLVQTGYIEESMFQWFGFTLDGGTDGKTVNLTVAASDGRYWRLSALVVLKPGL